MKKLIMRTMLVCFLIGISLCGCGGNRMPKETVTSEEINGRKVQVDWKTGDFSISGTTQKEQKYWIEDFVSWNHEGVTWDEETESNFPNYIELGQTAGKIYRLYPVIANQSLQSSRAVLDIFDCNDFTTDSMVLDASQMGAEEARGYMNGACVGKEGTLYYQYLSVDYNETDGLILGHQWIIQMDQQGKLVRKTDLTEDYLENQIVEKKLSNAIVLTGECLVDGQGNNYVITDSQKDAHDILSVFDKDGNFLTKMQMQEGEQLGGPCRIDDGEMLFWTNGQRGSRIFWYNGKGQIQMMGQLQDDQIQKILGLHLGSLFYQNEIGIVEWNLESGERQLIFGLEENGISDALMLEMIFIEKGTPILRLFGRINEKERDFVCHLSNHQMEKEETLEIVNLIKKPSSRVYSAILQVKMDTLGSSTTYDDQNNDDYTENRTRLLAEMAEGRGPDILYVSREELVALQEKGLVADLNEFIRPQDKERILQAVVNLGTVDDVFAGITPDIFSSTLMIGDQVWEKNSWTLEEVITLMKQGTLQPRILQGDGYFSGVGAARLLLEEASADSFLIDWEKKESHFDDERVVWLIDKMLSQPMEQIDINDWYSGNYNDTITVTYINDIQDIRFFCGIHNGRQIHYVGMPSASGNGNYIQSEGFLVINKNTTKTKQIKAFMNALLSEEIQYDIYNKAGLPVVRLDTEEQEWYDAKAYWQSQELTLGADKVSSMDATIELLDQSTPIPEAVPEAIGRILYEELDACYTGGRSARETVDIINNRIQLLLDELQ